MGVKTDGLQIRDSIQTRVRKQGSGCFIQERDRSGIEGFLSMVVHLEDWDKEVHPDDKLIQIKQQIITGTVAPTGYSLRNDSTANHTGSYHRELEVREADDSNCSTIKNALEMYGTLVGHQINYDKSFLVFKPNTPRVIKDRITHNLGVSVSTKIGKYLGTFVDNRLSDPQNYKALVERVNNILAGWKAKTLSQAGRLTLIKSVLQSLNIYQMSTLAVPKKYCQQMDVVCSNFFWGFRGHKLAMHLLNRNRIFAPRDRGGLGLRHTDQVNRALVTK
ncbi:putative RNA-directed DNA polymerase [Senna tora]|uniref:Putative RNA-directed DNA polymerase n=1 Tax=Senna tora TaxID=362788 RepID=A0A834WR43_9FABA|nr:putative RNA-directed DNA polymerase [Senna tora]